MVDYSPLPRSVPPNYGFSFQFSHCGLDTCILASCTLCFRGPPLPIGREPYTALASCDYRGPTKNHDFAKVQPRSSHEAAEPGFPVDVTLRALTLQAAKLSYEDHAWITPQRPFFLFTFLQDWYRNGMIDLINDGHVHSTC